MSSPQATIGKEGLAETLPSLYERYHENKANIVHALEAATAYTFAVQELVTARAKLAEALEVIYPKDGCGLLSRHAQVLSKHLDPAGNDSRSLVLKLKTAINSSRKGYETTFQNLEEKMGMVEETVSKSKKKAEKLSRHLSGELNAFQVQRVDLLDPVLVEVMVNELRVSRLVMHGPDRLFTLRDEAQNLLSSRSTTFTPKIDQSLKHLLLHPVSVEYLKSFFKERRMVESLHFWLDVQKFKKLEENHLPNGAKLIYDKYIIDSGERQVNLSSDLVMPLHSLILNPTRKMFDPAAKSTLDLLDGNLGGFHTSLHYQRMLSHLQPLTSIPEFISLIGTSHVKSPSLQRRAAMVSSKPTHTTFSPSMIHRELKDVAETLSTSTTASTTSSNGTPSNGTPSTPFLELTSPRSKVNLEYHSITNLREAKVSSMVPCFGDVYCGCLDGSILSLRWNRTSSRFDEFVAIPVGTIDGGVINMVKHTNIDILVLTEKGTILVVDTLKKKVTTKIGKSDQFFNGMLRIDQTRLWTFSGKILQDWSWHTKKKKFVVTSTKELPRLITHLLRVENSVWVGDELGGVTRLNMQTLHPLNERVRITSSPVHFCHRTEESTKVAGMTSVTVKVWVVCRNGVIGILDEKGALLHKLTNSVHDLSIVGACNIGKYVVLGSEDGSLSVWNHSHEFLDKLGQHVHRDSISALCATEDGTFLLSAGLDRNLVFWQQQKPRKHKSLTMDQQRVIQKELVFSDDEQDALEKDYLSEPETPSPRMISTNSPVSPNLDSLLIMSQIDNHRKQIPTKRKPSTATPVNLSIGSLPTESFLSMSSRPESPRSLPEESDPIHHANLGASNPSIASSNGSRSSARSNKSKSRETPPRATPRSNSPSTTPRTDHSAE